MSDRYACPVEQGADDVVPEDGGVARQEPAAVPDIEGGPQHPAVPGVVGGQGVGVPPVCGKSP
ncbi:MULTISPECIES: hypothetical protein [Streptomyces]|uniref:hypothetical protein n=1 Tax=Streptomyces TaxID=1883 RepID=UPI0022540001|nr:MULTISPECIES: hypothetical protein [Streptomyces]MCX4403863.1 hypothetical protein [Streptomyces sp. NBC_01764]MCX4432149.1 hypothetical protein [Streptomyces mirabilis]